MLIYLVFLIVCFGASIVGAICGIGGGVIIKPVLDSFGVLDVTAISFLSGCTVLSMTTYSVLKNKISGESHVTMKTGFPLAIGAAVGGLIGKWLFSYVKSLSSDPNKVGAVQALCLLIVTLGTLIYTIYKAKIKTYEVDSAIVCVLIGIFLGIMSSFLGIGGGPINLVVLFFFPRNRWRTDQPGCFVLLLFHVNKACSREFLIYYFLFTDRKPDLYDRDRKCSGFSDRCAGTYGCRWNCRWNLWTCDQ